MPLARTKRDEPTFTKADAYAMVGRLTRLWPFLCAEEGSDDDLAREYIAQFDGYDPIRVQDAVTKAIAKATKRAPTPGEIKEELRATTPAAPVSGREYRSPRPDYSQLPERIKSQEWAQRLMRLWVSPDYILARERDKALTAEAFANAKSLPEDDVCFGKRVRAVVAGLED